MISSILLSAFLTAAFVATGGYALLRWASLRAGVAGHHGDEIAELCHLLMSLAMIGMVYGYAGPVVDVVQIVGFGAFALYFLPRWVDGRRRTRPSAAHGCRGAGHHFVMSAAMVWMVAAMPLLMGPMTSGSSGGHVGHGGSDMATTTSVPAAPAPGWALAVSWVVIALLVVGAGFWARESLLAPVNSPDREPVLVGAGPTDTSGPGTPHPVARALTQRTDAACHCLMSLAMALGFLPML